MPMVEFVESYSEQPVFIASEKVLSISVDADGITIIHLGEDATLIEYGVQGSHSDAAARIDEANRPS